VNYAGPDIVVVPRTWSWWRTTMAGAPAAPSLPSDVPAKEMAMYSMVVVGLEGGERDQDVVAAARLVTSAGDELLRVALRGRGAAQLRQVAAERGAGLIVVGGASRSTLDRLVHGNDTLASAHSAPCPVLVAPIGYANEQPRLERIGIAYDGSGESELALRQARPLAEAHGARVIVRNAAAVPYYDQGNWAETLFEIDRELRDRVRRVLGDKLDVEVSVGFAPPRLELAAFSDGVDLLICGARRLGTLERAVHRSVSDYLASHCSCPVLIVPAAQTPGEACSAVRVARAS
jgi:nucleotide-binding universal stress UspA family protein